MQKPHTCVQPVHKNTHMQNTYMKNMHATDNRNYYKYLGIILWMCQPMRDGVTL